jgi:hypothetical protein
MVRIPGKDSIPTKRIIIIDKTIDKLLDQVRRIHI